MYESLELFLKTATHIIEESGHAIIGIQST